MVKALKKGQVSTEFVIVLCVFLLVFLAVFSFNSDVLQSAKDTFQAIQLRTALREVSTTAEIVHQQGAGARSRVFITLPEGVSSSRLANRTLSFTLDSGRVVYENTNFGLSGELPTNQGGHWVTIETLSNTILVYPDIFTIDPTSIYETICIANSSAQTISLRNLIEENLDFNISYSGDSEIGVQFSNDGFTISSRDTGVFDATISVLGNANQGTYYGEIIVYAISQDTGRNRSISIPLTVDAVLADTEFSYSIEGVIGILPDEWVISPIFPTQQLSNEFIAYSGFDINKSLILNFTGNMTAWFSFTPWGSNTTSNLNLTIEPRSYGYFTVYIRPPVNSTHANYTSFINGGYIKEVFGVNTSIVTRVLVNTTLIGDNVKPVVINTSVDSFVFEIGGYACVYADIADDNGIAFAAVEYLDAANTTQYVSMMYEQCISGKYSTNIQMEQAGTYLVKRVYAYDYASNYGYENTSIAIQSIFVSYGGGFNGTIEENPDDGCWISGGMIWNSSVVSFRHDGLYVDALDDEWDSGLCGSEDYDYVQFNFGNLSVINRTITDVFVSVLHQEDKDDGMLPSGVEQFSSRMMLQCYDGSQWRDMQPYPLSEIAWVNFTIVDISTCIRNHSIANNMMLRLTYDPIGNGDNAFQYIDWISAVVGTGDYYLIDLWPSSSSFPTRVDFTSFLNSTNNTFYVDTSTLSLEDELLLNTGFSGPSVSGWNLEGDIAIASGGGVMFTEDFEPADWFSDWTVVENSGVIERDTDQYAGSYALGFSGFGTGEGYISTTIDLSGYTTANLSFFWSAEDLESGDEGWLDIYDGVWHNAVMQFGPDNNGRHSTNPSNYNYENLDLSAYALGSDFSIRFRSSAEHAENSDKMLVDQVVIAVPGVFGLSDFWYVDANQSNFGSLNQNFTSPTGHPDIAVLRFKHSGNSDYFTGIAFAFCNLTSPSGIFTVWNETWTEDIHGNNPVTESINITGYLTSAAFTYNIKCGVFLYNTSDTIIAFDDISILVNYSGGSPTNDGWDWEDDTYGKDGSFGADFVTHSDPSGFSDNVLPGYIGVTIGGLGTGTANVMASGAWGIEFEISDAEYQVIANNSGNAYLSFEYMVIDLLDSTNGAGTGGVWVKARMGKEDERNYLGSNLDNSIDSTFHYTDETPEIWAAVDYEYPGWESVIYGNGTAYRSFSEDISQYITSAGRYYLDLGGKVSWMGGSKDNNEGVSFYFDNIRILIKY